jgi:hypothetical protein
MTISSVSQTAPANSAQSAKAAAPPPKPPVQQQDSVHLSEAAKKQSADADHDGDSH